MSDVYSENNLIWLDMEMTGLDPEEDKILELATIVTNDNLDILAEGPVFAIYQSDDILNHMGEWCINQHGKSGLTDRVKHSKINLAQAETETIAFLQQYVPAGKSPLCGNSICQDRRFLARYMPTLDRYFHYRHLDVSTLKILAQRWAPAIASNFIKESSHLALQDVHDSINELRYYRNHLFKK